ncbi:MAG: asparagine synthase C-terminal domain-containing protein, partial [Bacteroidota bacterium]|nr:asparagine synthase C-terminal domain-containing protein [Bacteroidota bacterium]
IKRRLRSDVPLGSSLSGGLDSSIIVTLLDQIDAEKDIKRKTFSASFPGFKKDETAYQKMVINDTSVEPHFVYPSEQSFLDNFNVISFYQDEPFGSASINIQYEVFRKAKEQNTTVLLDGQGADEVFAGYHGYYHAYFDELRKKGNAFKKEYALYHELHANNDINDRIHPGKLYMLKNVVPEGIKKETKKYFVKLPLAKKIFSQDFYLENRKALFYVRENFLSLNEALYYSIFHFGLEELLRYADRNSMAHSREVRLPFLNHELVEFVFSVPAHYKIRAGWTKWILRHTYQKLVDERIIWRKDKIGYAPPQNKWMQNHVVREHVSDAVSKLNTIKILNKGFVADESAISIDLKWRIMNIAHNL